MPKLIRGYVRSVDRISDWAGWLAASLIFSLALPALVSIAFGTLIVLWFTEPRMRAIDRQEILLSFAVAGLFMALMAAKWFTAAARVQ